MQTYRPFSKENLVETVDSMIEMAKSLNQEVKADLGKGTIVVRKEDTAEDVLSGYFDSFSSNYGELRADAIKVAGRVVIQQMVKMQREYDALILRLATLDFGSDEAVLDWICQFQVVSEDLVTQKMVEKQTSLVLDTFAINYFVVYTEDLEKDFAGVDSDEALRMVVGRALAHLQYENGVIPESFQEFTKAWRREFAQSV